jgi:integrase
MAPKSRATGRQRGRIEVLPSGSLRVKVYAGSDPITGRRHDLTETIPAGPRAQREAEKALTRLLNQVDERRNPKTKATLNQLLDRWLDVAELEVSTRNGYVRKLNRHVRPVLGSMQVGRLDAETLQSFYAVLRRCRDRCDGRRAGRHECRPLAPSTVRQIHSNLSAALTHAVLWGWIAVNPADVRRLAPAARKPDPQPPTVEQAARILEEAWRDPEWGMLVWLAMVTGARRGELCALAWDRLDFATGILTIRTSIAQVGSKTWEKDTKTHQQRRVTVDDQTLALLRAYYLSCRERADMLGFELPAEARMFSNDPDGSTWLKPDTVGQRYERMCARLGWNMNLHQLRHYSATELIGAGVDVRTVAGRLGHSGGGATTLKVYSAWLSEVDQRAAGSLVGRMPALPAGVDQGAKLVPSQRIVTEESPPYLRIAADLRAAITCGALLPGSPLPAEAELATRYGVAASTAHRAVAALEEAGLVSASRGKRATVRCPV